jgi:hypothetical protein
VKRQDRKEAFRLFRVGLIDRVPSPHAPQSHGCLEFIFSIKNSGASDHGALRLRLNRVLVCNWLEFCAQTIQVNPVLFQYALEDYYTRFYGSDGDLILSKSLT